MADLEDYSDKFIDVLFDNNVISAWLKGDFATALKQPEVRKFIMENQEHPAIVLWQNKEIEVQQNKETSEIQIDSHSSFEWLQAFLASILIFVKQLQESLLKESKESKEDFTKKFLAMDRKEFKYLFAEDDTFIYDQNKLMGRRLIRAGISGDLFDSQEDFDNWKKETIEAKKTKDYSDLSQMFLNMDPKEFRYLFSDVDTQIEDSGIIMNRRLTRAGVSGDLFGSQKDFNSWTDGIIAKKNAQQVIFFAPKNNDSKAPVQQLSQRTPG